MILYILIFCVLHGQADQYDDEYKDESIGGTGNDPFEEMFVRVSSNGEVRPFHFNPASRNSTDEKPIQRIPKKKVIGGSKSAKGAVPYIVGIQSRGSVMCGGSIYNSVTVLTAAHCFHANSERLPEYVTDKFEYVAGDFDASDADGDEQRRRAVDVKIHPKYTADYNFYDIAIVTVDKPFEYNKLVQPLPIDRPPLVPEDVGIAMISGWGYTKKKGVRDNDDPIYYPDVLRQANVKVFSVEECYEFYKQYDQLEALIDAGLICAGFESGKIDACQGDSGGPLACFNPEKKNRRFLCGLVSTGVGCGLPDFPGFYTRVAEFHDWVIENSGYADMRTIDDARPPPSLDN